MASMSMRQYAKHRGVTVEAVSKAVKRGRITCERNERGHAMIDPEVADREWVANQDLTQFRRSGPGSHPGSEDASEEAKSSPKVDDKAGIGYRNARAIRETFNAKLAQIEFEELQGKLVRADEIEKRWTDIASAVRTRVLGIASKAKQRIPGLTVHQYKILDSIVVDALESLVESRDEKVVDDLDD